MALSARFLYFAIERAAEPISQRLENYASSSPRFRGACRQVAEWQSKLAYNKDLRRIAHEQRLANEQGQDARPGSGGWTPIDDVEPPPQLSEREATTQGCELLGEGFVICVGLGLLVHQAAADRADEAAAEARIEANEARIKSLEGNVETLKRELEAFSKAPGSGKK